MLRVAYSSVYLMNNVVCNAAAGTEGNMVSIEMPLFNERTTGGVTDASSFLFYTNNQ